MRFTDMADEMFGAAQGALPAGVRLATAKRGGVTITRVEIAREGLAKPRGRYVTLEMPSVSVLDERDAAVIETCAAELRALLPPEGPVLVLGIGNRRVTADALGPKTGDYVLATRHLGSSLKKEIGLEGLKNVSYIGTGVLGETGIESAEIVKGVAQIIKPSCIIAVDALAASSASRLGTTLQFSGAGIVPGSGVGNHRFELSSATLGVPVISVGIPTVIGASLLSGREQDKMFVTPREIDAIIRRGAKLIGMCTVSYTHLTLPTILLV